jgi:hypothetical protein
VDTPVPTHKPFVDAPFEVDWQTHAYTRTGAASHMQALRLNGPGSPISVTLGGVARRYDMFSAKSLRNFQGNCSRCPHIVLRPHVDGSSPVARKPQGPYFHEEEPTHTVRREQQKIQGRQEEQKPERDD